MRLDKDALANVRCTNHLGDTQLCLPSTLPSATDHNPLQTQLMSMMDMLTKTFAAQQATTGCTNPPTPSFKEPKVKDPDTFDGSTKTLNSFLTKCEIVFELQSSRFGDDCTKITYMISLLGAMPLEAIRLYITSSIKPSFLLNFNRFILRLKLNYGDPDWTGTAQRKLKVLCQTTSASAYSDKF